MGFFKIRNSRLSDVFFFNFCAVGIVVLQWLQNDIPESEIFASNCYGMKFSFFKVTLLLMNFSARRKGGKRRKNFF